MKNFNGPFGENFLFQLKKGKKKKKKKDRDPTISAVTNIHTRFYIQIREYPSTRILAAALLFTQVLLYHKMSSAIHDWNFEGMRFFFIILLFDSCIIVI